MKYQHIFFDLDRTLWDFEANSSDVLHELYYEFSVGEYCESFDSFFKKYQKINKKYWKDYRNKRVSKEKLSWSRFYDTLIICNIDNEKMAKQMASEYVERSPYKTKLFPKVISTLEKLREDFQLHIITNGFSEVQFIKLKESKLDVFAKSVTISEEAAKPKPHTEFFDLALNKAGAIAENSLVVGDDLETDILGAKNYGIDYVWFNPQKLRHRTVVAQQMQCIDELLDIVYNKH